MYCKPICCWDSTALQIAVEVQLLRRVEYPHMCSKMLMSASIIGPGMDAWRQCFCIAKMLLLVTCLMRLFLHSNRCMNVSSSMLQHGHRLLLREHLRQLWPTGIHPNNILLIRTILLMRCVDLTLPIAFQLIVSYTALVILRHLHPYSLRSGVVLA